VTGRVLLSFILTVLSLVIALLIQAKKLSHINETLLYCQKDTEQICQMMQHRVYDDGFIAGLNAAHVNACNWEGDAKEALLFYTKHWDHGAKALTILKAYKIKK